MNMKNTSHNNSKISLKSLKSGDRRYLSKAITLLESNKSIDHYYIRELLNALPTPQEKTYRIGISGAPGVGKSTFINAFVKEILAHTTDEVAVLTIDPTSARSGGSILGDKTRMEEIASDPRVFIRPSPSGEAFDGTATSTREAITLCEVAGFKWIIVETVGVGQLDAEVHAISDFFMFLTQPAAGDEIQQIKRGNIEWANAVVVNKADGKLYNEALRLVQQLRAVATFYKTHEEDEKLAVFECSSLDKKHIKKVFLHAQKSMDSSWDSKKTAALRAEQNQKWFAKQLKQDIVNKVMQMSRLKTFKEELELKVAAGQFSSYQALKVLNKELDKYIINE